MATLVFWLKYWAIVVALGFCPVSQIVCSIALASCIALDLWHAELLERRGRESMLTKIVCKKVDRVIDEERATCRKILNQD